MKTSLVIPCHWNEDVLEALAHYGRYSQDILRLIKEDLADEKNG